MPTQKIITVYTYDELNEQAQKTAQNRYYHNFYYDPFWIRDNLALINAKAVAWDADYGTATIAPIKKEYTTRDILEGLAALPEDEEYYSFSKDAAALLAKNKRLNRLNTIWFKARHNLARQEALGETYNHLEVDIQNETDDLLASLGKVVGKALRQEYERQTSAEYVADYFLYNEYLFFFNGTVAPRDLQDAPLALAQN
jgi:hypothetical protein